MGYRDAMSHEQLWAPWRMAYLAQLDPSEKPSDTPAACFLCDAAALTDDDAGRGVLARTPHSVLLLNRYPYTNGHLLVAPKRHIPDLASLTAEERADAMELVARAQSLLQEVMHPQGMNIGINLGRCAGAGLPGHVHVHLVPRWNGDTNFLPLFGNVRVIPQALEQTYQWLAEAVKTGPLGGSRSTIVTQQ